MRIFISGSRSVHRLDERAEYDASRVIKDFCLAGNSILVGDAHGADRAVQALLRELGHSDVVVYTCREGPRNNLGQWPVRAIETPAGAKGFGLHRWKDEAMARDADEGFMIWDGVSRGTLNNIVNMVRLRKQALVYLARRRHFVLVKDGRDLRALVYSCGGPATGLYEALAGTPQKGGTEAWS